MAEHLYSEPEAATDPNVALRELRAALDMLSRWEQRPWPDVGKLLRSAPLLTWEQLRAPKLWHGLGTAEQAAVHWMVATGQQLGEVQERFVRPQRHAPAIAALCTDLATTAATFSSNHHRWPEADPDRAAQTLAVADHLSAYTRLRHTSQVKLMRLMTGRAVGGQPSWASPTLAQVLAEPDALSDYEVFAEGDEHRDRGQFSRGAHEEITARFGRLPIGWQIETLRRIDKGAVPIHVISEAAIAINVIRSHYGQDFTR